ncbi:hypothetical protein [Arthrobacter sp.]|uniref:hypothetical protein n=1 Tax=Arthrobacter sp. TaxID=1667 RepID=UPI0026E010D6|nr:hypothetical protein [Arthrobacter sp.]MDO5754592.1 hypothetical protein [Arthrobacter sp.]
MNFSLAEVAVQTNTEGVPLTVHRNGREWIVGAEPLRWYERRQWWKQAQRMPRGHGRVDVQVWRIQARLGRNMRSELVTMELECDAAEGRWLMREPLSMAG